MSASAAEPFLRRVSRDTCVVALLMGVAALAVWPSHPARALGVLGGFALIALSYWGIRAGVGALFEPAGGASKTASGEAALPLPKRRPGFVKFFTRHAMLAASAYVMIARFEFDPVAMLAGVTTPAIAVAVEIMRSSLSRPGGPHSRSL